MRQSGASESLSTELSYHVELMDYPQKASRISGMTLVELLIVVMLIAVTASLVSPTIGRQLDQARARDELQSLKRLVAGLGFESYSRSQQFTITAEGSVLFWAFAGGQGERRFEKLFFSKKQVFFYNSNGVANQQDLTVDIGSTAHSIYLNSWVEQ